MQNNNKNDNWLSGLAKAYQELNVYLSLGVQLAVTMVVMFFLGKFLDEKLNTTPFLVIGFSLFGGFAGTYNFIRTVNNINKKQNHKKN